MGEHHGRVSTRVSTALLTVTGQNGMPVPAPQTNPNQFSQWFPPTAALVAWIVAGFTVVSVDTVQVILFLVIPFVYVCCIVGLIISIRKKMPRWVILANGLFLLAGIPLLAFSFAFLLLWAYGAVN